MPLRVSTFCALLALATGLPGPLPARSATHQALVDALVDEGVLTEQQAANVLSRVQQTLTAEKPDAPATVAPLRLGRAVQQLRLFGDLRLRHQRVESSYWDSGNYVDEENRYRVRLRAGGEFTFEQGWSAALRFDTSSAHTGRNADFGNNARRNDLGVFLGVAQIAYEFTDPVGPLEDLRIVAGKQHLPFYANGAGGFFLSRELTVEGLTEEARLSAAPFGGALVARAGQYLQRVRQRLVTGEGERTHIDYLLMGQLEFAAETERGVRVVLAPTFLGFVASDHPGASTADALSDFNRPMDSNFANLANLILPAQVTWPVGRETQITLFGTYSHNLEGRSRARRFLGDHRPLPGNVSDFYNLGVAWARARTELAFEYRDVGAGALTNALSQPAFNGGRNNARGFVLELTQGLADGVEANLTWVRSSAIHRELGGFTTDGGTTSDGLGYRNYDLIMVDLLVKF